jgi:lipopolysaccharide biosynthesis glycosyltransferase
MEISKRNTIPIFFTFNDNYAFPAEVAIYSLLKYADKQYFYKLYVLHDSLSLKNQSELSKIVKPFEDNATLEFINVKEFHQNSDWEQINNKQHYSKEIYNKLIADLIFPQYNRIMCFDVDMIFKGDISKSFYLNQNADFLVEGIRTIFKDTEKVWEKANYTPEEKKILSKSICAGYIILNLKQLRETDAGAEMRTYYKNNLENLILPEQDVINICCYPKIGYLPYSCMVDVNSYSITTTSIFCDDLNDAEFLFTESLKNPVVIHYAGYNKPWNSFVIKKWSSWMQEVIDAGLITEYFLKLPSFLLQRRKKYNLLRFCRKMKKKLTVAICKK